MFTALSPNNVDTTEINACLDDPCQLSLPINAFTSVHNLHLHKVPGHDSIVKEVSNISQSTGYANNYLQQHAKINLVSCSIEPIQVIIIAKSGKPPIETKLCHPIRLLPLMSKFSKYYSSTE